MCTIEKVSFPSRGDQQYQLSGTLWIAPESDSAPDVVCVMVHPWGFLGGSSANMNPFAEILAAEYRISCLTFDLRGVGYSQGTSTYRCKDEVNDVIGACAFIKTKCGKPVSFMSSKCYVCP